WAGELEHVAVPGVTHGRVSVVGEVNLRPQHGKRRAQFPDRIVPVMPVVAETLATLSPAQSAREFRKREPADTRDHIARFGDMLLWSGIALFWLSHGVDVRRQIPHFQGVDVEQTTDLID